MGAAKSLALVDRVQRPRRCGLVRPRDQLQIANLQLFHADVEHDAALVQEDHVGEDVLDLLDLMGRDQDRAVPVEIVVEQAVVELLAIDQVQPQRRLVQHQQPRIDGHDQGEVELGDHTLAEFMHPAFPLDGGPGQEALCLGPVEARMDALHIVDHLRHAQAARQDRHVGDETDVAHQVFTGCPGIAAQHAEVALIGRQSQYGVDRGGLAGAVGADQADDPTCVDLEIDTMAVFR